MIVSTLFLGFLLTVFFVINKWLLKYYTLRKIYGKLPGPKNIPIIGQTWEITRLAREDRFQWFNNLCFKYPEGIVVTWLGTDPFVTIRKPQQMEVILSSTKLITKGKMYLMIKPWLGNGLVTSTGQTWSEHRRLLTPAFHFGVLEEYAAVMREKVLILNDCIEKQVRADPNKPINIFDLAVRYTLDTICETAMRINMDTLTNPDNSYVKALHNFSRLSTERFVRPWLRWDAIYFRTQSGKEFLEAIRTMHTFTETVIKNRQLERQQKKKAGSDVKDEYDEFGKRKRTAFLDLLFDASENSSEKPLTFQELREEVDTFMFAGHDTTAAAISWTLFILGNHPEVQAKLHEELKETFGNDTETATTKQLSQLKYLDRVLKEALRMYPSAASVSRLLDHDTTMDNYFLPKGTLISIHIYQLHHDPEVWKDPETFDPDRFLPENSQGRHPYAYVPFSAGPRNCIGQKFAQIELKTALTAILRKWRVKSVLKPSEVKMIHNFIIRPNNEKLELYFTPNNG